MGDGAGGDVFLLLPWVLLEGGASKDCLGMGGLGWVVANLLVEWALVEGGVLLRTMLLMERRPPL